MSRVSHNFFNKPSESLKIVGVTGTKGKTTITNYIATVLNEAGINTGVIGTNGTFFNGTYEVTANTTPVMNFIEYLEKCLIMAWNVCQWKFHQVE